MNKTLYLHIGTGKTGTSALQHFFNQNRDRLAEKGLYYPRTGQLVTGDAHYAFHAALQGPSSGLPVNESYEFYFSRLKEEVAFTRCDAILLSDEALFTRFDIIGPLLSDCAAFFSDVKIIVYLRRNDLFAQSYYKQNLIAAPLDKTIEEYRCEQRPVFLDYYKPISRFADLFSRENIIVKCYEKQQFKDQNLFADFLDIFGINLSRDFVLPERSANPTLTADAIEFLRLINRHDPKNRGPLIHRIRNFFGISEYGMPVPELLPPGARIQILAKSEESNRKIAREFLHRKDGKLFYDSWPDPNEPWEPYDGLELEKTIEFTSIIWNELNRQIDGLNRQIAELQGSRFTKTR